MREGVFKEAGQSAEIRESYDSRIRELARRM